MVDVGEVFEVSGVSPEIEVISGNQEIYIDDAITNKCKEKRTEH